MNIFLFKLTVWGALAYTAVLESIRRKDLWVAAILAVVMIGAASVIGHFGVRGLEMFLKDVTLTVVNILSVILAVLFAARQMPEEISRRTIYPLLARPVTRFDLIFGKFLGALTLSTISLLTFTVIGWGALLYFGLGVGAIFWQYLLLRFFSLAIICALTIALSLFLTPQATATMALLLAIGSSTFSTAVTMLHGSVGSAVRKGLEVAYFTLPQLDLFDLSKKVSYGWKPISGTTVLLLLIYAVVHSAIFLMVGAIRFRRQAL
ncbi:MAG: ABC transporter permease [Capsulimonadales bacterium]|nr:ABC transporter permease [Capsulimonadales bacterium]